MVRQWDFNWRLLQRRHYAILCGYISKQLHPLYSNRAKQQQPCEVSRCQQRLFSHDAATRCWLGGSNTLAQLRSVL